MAAIVRVGVLNDMADLGAASEDMSDWLEREVLALRASGRITVPVEFVHAYGLGLPTGTAEAIEHAFTELAAQHVVLIVGPSFGDNALLATPLAERLRVPTINWGGAERARGKYMFQLQAGSPEDESIVIARHLAHSGLKRIGVAHDRSPLATRRLKYLEDEAAVLGLEIVAVRAVSPLPHAAQEDARAILSRSPDAFVYLGAGAPLPALADAIALEGWTGTRVTNTAGLGGFTPQAAQSCEGWTYIDMHADSNRTLAALRTDHDIAPAGLPAAARGHDLGRLVAEGIARAHGYTREGIRNGLEQVRWLPAAQGHEGTLLGFGVQDRGALHGRYLVVRQWSGGESVELG